MIKTAKDFKDEMVRKLTTTEGSGLKQHRGYLGMSAIGHCPRQLYDEFMRGRRPARPGDHWRCWLGLMYELAVGELLALDIAPVEEPLIAGFDNRYRGHPDYETPDHETLIEIKTTTLEAFRSIRQSGEYPESHHAQVQAYLQHGMWKRAILVYMARDVPNRNMQHIPVWTFNVYQNEDVGEALDAKARKILQAIDNRTPPACMCGRHMYERKTSP